MRLMLKLLLSFLLSAGSLFLHAQYSMGVTGLLTIPSADMQADGMFMAGGNYLPEAVTPGYWDYNTGNYYVNITFLPFVEMAYRCTLLRGNFDKGNKWQQDRSVSLRLRPLKEGKWWPAVVVGSNDAFTTNKLNPFDESKGNRYFSSIYAVATKHWSLGRHVLGLTLGGNIPFRKDNFRKGVFGGVSYAPAFLKTVVLMADYDSRAVSLGASARLFNHLSLHAFCYDFKAVSAGIRYEIQLKIGFAKN